VGRIVERLLMRNLRLRQLKYWPKGARSDMVEQEFEAKFPGHNSPGLSSCSDCGPEEENMAKTEAAENNGRSWALFQKDWVQNQSCHHLAVCPQASYSASLNLDLLPSIYVFCLLFQVKLCKDQGLPFSFGWRRFSLPTFPLGCCED